MAAIRRELVTRLAVAVLIPCCSEEASIRKASSSRVSTFFSFEVFVVEGSGHGRLLMSPRGALCEPKPLAPPHRDIDSSRRLLSEHDGVVGANGSGGDDLRVHAEPRVGLARDDAQDVGLLGQIALRE